MVFGKHIRLSRKTREHIRKFYSETVQWLNRGVSVVIFPEGTRSETGEMSKFQNGAFKIALKEKIPILPVRIRGTRKILQKGSKIINARATVALTVFPPIDTKKFEIRELSRLKDMVCSALR